MLTHRYTRLSSFVFGLAKTPTEALKAIVQEKRYPVLMREAALRWLIYWAPLSVTRGAPFAAKRRYVRQHYGV